MALLIDGYNLLHATDIFGSEPGNFQQTREALLDVLAATLQPSERKEAIIVFDAADAPPGLPSTMEHELISVRYARNYPDADTLIEEIIENHRAPRSLMVVSSDHRVQRAARRRGASYVDSDQWYEELSRRHVVNKHQHLSNRPEKPTSEMSAAEIARWVREFEGEGGEKSGKREGHRKPSKPSVESENPFPPGYAEDLLDES